MQRLLVTGAAGFVGGAVLKALGAAGYALRATWRRSRPATGCPGVEWRQDDLETERDRSGDLLRDVDTVVHLAARAHVGGVRQYWSGPFRRANALATQRLAQQALGAGVRRFVYMSTVGVHGGENRLERGLPVPLQSGDPLQPQSPYARSKLAGEQVLSRICGAGPMELVTLRAPLVFGPGGGGNFLRLLRFLDHGLPLPTGSRPAPRSLVYVENLAQLLVTCLAHPGVANRTYLLADFDLAVTVLAGKLADLLGRRLRTLQLPEFLLRSGALRSLTQPLLIDGRPIRETTGWQPGIGPDAALAQTVAWYRSAR